MYDGFNKRSIGVYTFLLVVCISFHTLRIFTPKFENILLLLLAILHLAR